MGTSDRWGGQICKILCQIFSEFNIPKIIKICKFLTELSKNKKLDVFWNTEYV